MASLLEENYIDKILAHKDLFVSELAFEFGSQYEDLLNERFDKIQFVLFTSLLNMRMYLRKKYSFLVTSKLVDLIKEKGLLDDVFVSDRFKNICGYTLASNDVDRFSDLFDSSFLDFDFEERRKKVFGIFSFDTSLSSDILNVYAKNRDCSVSLFIRNNRCNFLRKSGIYPYNYSDEMICGDYNYSMICKQYEDFMQEYNRILDETKLSLKDDIDIFYKLQNANSIINSNNYKMMLDDLKSYLSLSDRKKIESGNYDLNDIDFIRVFFNKNQSLNDPCKLEELNDDEIRQLLSLYYGDESVASDFIERVVEARVKAAKRYNKQIMNAFVFDSNGDISSIEIDKDLSLTDGELFSSFKESNGIESRLIFLDPYASSDDSLDIHLRHELRHSLTSSSYQDGDFEVVKVGNTEYRYMDDVLVETNNEFFNELLTQASAIENTKKSYQNGIYVLSPSEAHFPSDNTSIYDQYLPLFNRVRPLLPNKVITSQIEPDNSDLYKFMSKEVIKRLEDEIHSYYISDDFLNDILSRSNNTSLSPQ